MRNWLKAADKRKLELDSASTQVDNQPQEISQENL
jgi:hypothetical protein